MTRHWPARICLAAAAVAAVTSACSRQDTAPTQADTSADRLSATSLPGGPPLVTKWLGANHMLRTEPRMLFAAWTDGTVLWWTQDRLMKGHVAPDAVTALEKRMQDAGMFRSLPVRRHVVVDGPEYIVAARDSAGALSELRFDGDEDLARRWISPHSVPSQSDVEQLLNVWKKTCTAINAAVPANGVEFKGTHNLQPPERG